MSDRGDYRPLFCAFWDDPDVHALSHAAYRVLTTLKGTLPAAGIGVVYLALLATRCAMSIDDVERALEELETPAPGKAAGWIVRERNIIWIVNGLRFEPTLSSANKKHRAFIADRILAPLGDRPIVQAFCRHYPHWFAAPSGPSGNGAPSRNDTKGKGIERVSDGSGMAIEGVSNPSPAQPSPAQPDSSPYQPKPAQTREPAAAAVGDADPELLRAFAERLAEATNRAITDRWGQPERPIQPFGVTRDVARRLIEAGISVELATSTILEKVRVGRFGSVPASVAYFAEAIIEAHQAELHRHRDHARPLTGALEPVSQILDRERQQQAIENAYVAERAKVVAAWRSNPANAEQLAAIEADAESEFPTRNPFAKTARLALITQRIAAAAGFADLETWTATHTAKAS